MSAVTAFQRVAVALGAALSAAPALAAGAIKANPTRPFPREVATCISVRLSRAQQTGGTNCGEIWACEFEFDIEGRGVSGAGPADAVDALLSAVAARVSAADLSAVGVTERLPESSIDWVFEAGDTPLAQALYRINLAIHVADDLTVSP